MGKKEDNIDQLRAQRMISLFQRVLVLFVCLARGEVDAEMTNRTTASGCPSFTEIPVASMHPGQPERDWFYSGRHYGGLGHEIPALACNDDGGPWDDGYNVMYPDVQGTFGSIMVNPGCTFYFFQKPNYEGKHVEYRVCSSEEDEVSLNVGILVGVIVTNCLSLGAAIWL